MIFVSYLTDFSYFPLIFFHSQSCRTQSEQVKNLLFERGCRWFQLFFIYFHLFYFFGQNHPCTRNSWLSSYQNGDLGHSHSLMWRAKFFCTCFHFFTIKKSAFIRKHKCWKVHVALYTPCLIHINKNRSINYFTGK